MQKVREQESHSGVYARQANTPEGDYCVWMVREGKFFRVFILRWSDSFREVATRDICCWTPDGHKADTLFDFAVQNPDLFPVEACNPL